MPIDLYFDSHCHLQDARFDPDRDEAMARAWEAGVREIVVIGSDPESAAQARALAAAAADQDMRPRLWFTAGLHPHEASRWSPDTRRAVEAELDRGAIAVGEIGLDHHYDNSPRAIQRIAFVDQLAIARERDLPAIVHSRDAEEDTMRLLDESGIIPARVVLHCFTGSAGMLGTAVERGFYVSFSGIATFGSFDAAGLVPAVPADRLLVETDAPYLAPVPHRGGRNEPAFLPATVSVLADRRGVPAAELAAVTRANARDFYSLT
ncbi:MAG TPA: TatD family hydrolase [Gemmatimonadota bacterium]|nr:TatD family hydrolase [Gemmatimonadota bacterium]